ncbi:hypothetical protein LTS08_005828 [Lithohypha guttulata]|nr:hypothetical protein LTS08_005828 [Lithohypha guttulata]
MAVSGILFELPTDRQSRYYDPTALDVHDPNWIPVLNGAQLKVDFPQPSFSAIPSIPNPHASVAEISLKRSKSSSAPEAVVQKHIVRYPSQLQIKSKSVAPQELSTAHSPIGGHDLSNNANFPTASNEIPVIPGSIPTQEENLVMIPGNIVPQTETIATSLPHATSTRSSISSVKKSHVPTSRFNQKASSMATISSVAQQSHAQSPLPSRVVSPEPQRQLSQITTIPTPPLPPTPEPSRHISSSISKTQKHKSTASERRARALHSNPSNVSLGPQPLSRSNSLTEELEEVPLIHQIAGPASRASSTRSRSQSICTSQPTPAPTTPLPELPRGAPVKRPPTREREKVPPVIEKTSPIVKSSPSFPSPAPSSTPSPVLPPAQNEHVEMANFMHTRRTTIFRRFDDVHVRLLLHLQDEISALEKELLDIEQSGPGRPDHLVRKPTVMRELRKTLAEYDHLFANWSSMQANKASDELKEQLAKWLQAPDPEGSTSKTAQADLVWLKDSKDLSAVSLDPEKKLPEISSFSKVSTKEENKIDKENGRNGASFLAMFSCTSKRK